MKNWFDRMFRKKPAEEWRLVHTHDLTWKRTKPDGTVVKSGTVFAHFFESSKGNRYVKLIAMEVPSWLSAEEVTIRNHAELVERIRKEGVKSYSFSTKYSDAQVCEFILTNEMWNDIVYQWLAGRMDPKIPTYAEVPKREFAEALAGKKV